MNHMLVVLLAAFLLDSFVICESKPKCEICTDLVKRFKEGLEKTANSNFGGGNTNWEEKKLGSFASSETRFLEVLEGACEDGSRECHYMLEENEEVLEQWFFLEYSRGLDDNLQKYFCIDKLKVCCPTGTFGPQCEECPGGKDRPCTGNGNCEGSGSRDGKGTCSCHSGYKGTLCNECSASYYEESRNETHLSCKACHAACKTSCTGPDRSHCDGCREGWEPDDEEGCVDVDECDDDVSVCKENEYCSNTEGSFRCSICHHSCNGCTEYGSSRCKACNSRYYLRDGSCERCHQSCTSSCTDDTSATCDSCAEGWRLSDDNSCQDVDECKEGLKTCEENKYCVNTDGSSYCALCHEACLSCTGPSASNCVQCKPGYALSEDGSECTDVDECASEPSPCSNVGETCINTVGSYRCDCAEGFQRRQRKCEPKPAKKVKTKQKKQDKRPDSAKEEFNNLSTDDFGKSMKVEPLNDENIVMEGKLNIPNSDSSKNTESDVGNARSDL